MVEVKNVTFSYEDSPPVLEEVSLSIAESGLYIFLGKNGSGKTTILDLIFGFLTPVSGKVLYRGKEVREPLSGEVVYMISDPERYFFEPTVVDEVAYALRFKGMKAEEAQKKAVQILSQAGIESELFYRDPLRLSKGEKRRVALASLLFSDADLVLMDEPTSGLDRKGKQEFTFLVRSLLDKGKTVVATSQNLNDFLEFQPVVFIVSQKKVIKVDLRDVPKAVKDIEEAGLQVPEKLRVAHVLLRKGISVNPFKKDLEFAREVADILTNHEN